MRVVKNPTLKSQGVKYDNGKLRFDLIPADVEELLAAVYTFGARKYADDNWRLGMEWKKIYGAIRRHLNAFWQGQDLDEETGLPHLIAVAWGCFTLIHYMTTHRKMDGRIQTWGNNAQYFRILQGPAGNALSSAASLNREAAGGTGQRKQVLSGKRRQRIISHRQGTVRRVKRTASNGTSRRGKASKEKDSTKV